MKDIQRVWEALERLPDVIRSLLPWDVGQSQLLLWGSAAIYVVGILLLAQAFGWFCGWLVRLFIQPRN
ncbi:hypothetical protein [Bradyrhizobium pachyrhizi]|uniref:hypothetical protein n=1 Tax=Bradyrhizobium pachyrhizi TaxID=280333 RepID=UPI00067DDBB9|nr:hypothetical protein [Bradyrhizobium pachyrhizi]